MTGYGYCEIQNGKVHLSLDLKSYNNRYLDIVINMPPFLNSLEPKIREYLSSRLSRGRVEVFIRIRELQEDLKITVDSLTVQNYMKVLNELTKIAEIEPRVTLTHLLKMEGVLKTDKNRDLDYYWSVIRKALDTGFPEFEEARKREGDLTLQDITNLISEIREKLSIIEKHASAIEAKITETLKQRFYQLLGEDYDESRVYSETAVMLVKYDINEELMRMKSHLDNFSAICGSGEAAGKKLDFICQELNREINTIGSKSIILEVNRGVIDIKDAIEKIREQLRNVE